MVIAHRQVTESEVEEEIQRLQDVLVQAKDQLQTMRNMTAKRMGNGEAAVFDAHMAFLEDPAYTGEMVQRVRDKRVNVESVVAEVTDEMAAMLASLPDEYLRARADDIRDVGNRLLHLLAGEKSLDLALLPAGSIVVAEELAPSDVAAFSEGVAGMVTARGSRTAHAVIMAKSLGIPAVVGLGEGIQHIAENDTLVLDGDQGLVVTRPSAQEQQEIRDRIDRDLRWSQAAGKRAKEPAISRDGVVIDVFANIGHLKDIPLALANGADGVGLFRTEFLYLDSDHWPTEEEQYTVYRQSLEAFADKPVMIRTLDIGGDKPLPYAKLPKEENPFLGYRAIRFCLDNPDIFKTQLRALLRASSHGQLWIMLPMVENLQEVRAAKSLVATCRQELATQGYPVADKIPLGIMVEIPAAAVAADTLAKEVDFMSIGTNDLTQYTLAADRGNEKIAYLYDAVHPAVLRLVRMTCEAGRKANIPVGMCGELAGDAQMTEALLGLGLTELSMGAAAIPRVKERVRVMSCQEAEPWALRLLNLESPADVRTVAANRSET